MRILRAAFVVASIIFVQFFAVSGADSAEPVIRDLKNTQIIKSHESPHNILSEACLACHPKDRFDFWLLVYKGTPPVVSVDAPAKAEEAAPAKGLLPKNRFNSHDALSCTICHLENPTAQSPRFLVDIEDLCRLCHPTVQNHRLPDGARLARVKEAIASGKLPGKSGGFLCTTCHRLHDVAFGVREEYVRTLYEGTVPNPHGDRSLCFSCHLGKIKEGEEVQFTKGRDSNDLCNDCHKKPNVKPAPHVVDAVSTEGTWRMDYVGYPLNQGKLLCVTCHLEASQGKRDPANPKFLRGGPYDEKDKFCYRCHLEDKDAGNSPHRQLDPFGKVRPESCLFCHKKVPNPAKPTRIDSELISDESVICMNCHPNRPHPDKDHLVRPGPNYEKKRREYEIRHEVKLPLAPDGTITCSTCHNPHAKGVLTNESGVGAGSKYRVPDFREVCAPCHGRFY